MGLILHVTAAGRAQRVAARLTGSPLPKFKSYVIDQAEEQPDIDNPVLDVLYESQPSDEFYINELDDFAFSIRSVIPAQVKGWIRGIGLKDESGVIYCYHRFAEENGGMYKPEGTIVRFPLILAEDGRESVEFTYSSVDLSGMKEEIMAEMRLEIAAMIESYLCNGIKVPNLGETLNCEDNQ